MRFFNVIHPSSGDAGGDGEERRNIRLLVLTIGFALALPLLFWGVRAAMNKIQALRDEHDTTLQPSPPHQGTIRLTWVGEIVGVEKGAILVRDVTGTGGGGTKRVTISSETLISQLAFVPVITNGQKSFAQEEKTLAPSGLKSGWRVDVVSAEDVSHADEFRAVQIRVLP